MSRGELLHGSKEGLLPLHVSVKDFPEKKREEKKKKTLEETACSSLPYAWRQMLWKWCVCLDTPAAAGRTRSHNGVQKALHLRGKSSYKGRERKENYWSAGNSATYQSLSFLSRQLFLESL